VIGDITTKESAPTAWAVWAFAFGIGRVIATGLGGFLARPGVTWPAAFPAGSVFATYPYLFPCLLSGGLCVVGFLLTALVLPETLARSSVASINTAPQDSMPAAPRKKHAHKRHASDGDLYGSAVLPASDADSEPDEQAPLLPSRTPTSVARLDGRLVVTLFMTQLFVWTAYQVYDEVFTLWATSSASLGGLGFSTSDSGIYFGQFGVEVVIASILIYPPIGRRFTPLVLHRVGTLLAIVFFACIPLAHEALVLSRAGMWALLVSVSFVGTVSSGLSSPSLAIIINSAAPDASLLGRLNGILQAAVAVARVVGPTAGGSLVAWSLHSGLAIPFDYHFTYWVMAVLMALVLLLTLWLRPRTETALSAEHA
jgi:hypothetical protein